jgi:large subunit ribosomal protein L7e
MVGHSKKSDLMLVPESVLKKRHDLDDLARRRSASEQYQKKITKAASGKKAFYVRKPESFLVRGRAKRNNAIRYSRVLKKGMQTRASHQKVVATQRVVDEKQEFSITYQANSVGAPMVFCIRIRDDVGMPSVVRKILRKWRLNAIHEGVFLRYDTATRQSLHLVEPFVVYGHPTKAVVTDLIERRGHGFAESSNSNNERVPLSDNTVIETALAEQNIICVEDLVHELCVAGDSFDAASSFLCPFQLADARSEFERRTLKMKNGKDYGDRGDAINEYIKQVL